MKELRDNFSRRDANTVAQLNNSKKTEALQRSEIGKLKTYVG